MRSVLGCCLSEARCLPEAAKQWLHAVELAMLWSNDRLQLGLAHADVEMEV